MSTKKLPQSIPISPASARATIADVARAASVSKATVSRFLNHRDKLLTKEIATRVEVAIAALSYSPSPMAQALKRGRSRLIGLVVADVTNPFSVAVLRGAEKACQEAGYLLMLFNLGNDSGREREAIEALTAYQVEGFILNTLGHDAGAAADAARQFWAPTSRAAGAACNIPIEQATPARTQASWGASPASAATTSTLPPMTAATTSIPHTQGRRARIAGPRFLPNASPTLRMKAT